MGQEPNRILLWERGLHRGGVLADLEGVERDLPIVVGPLLLSSYPDVGVLHRIPVTRVDNFDDECAALDLWRLVGERRLDDAGECGAVRRRSARPAVVQHRVPEAVHVFALDLDIERPGTQKLRRSLGVRRHDPAAGRLARDVPGAVEGGPPDGHGVTFDGDLLRVPLWRTSAGSNVGKWCGYERRRRARHLAHVRYRGCRYPVASGGYRGVWHVDTHRWHVYRSPLGAPLSSIQFARSSICCAWRCATADRGSV